MEEQFIKVSSVEELSEHGIDPEVFKAKFMKLMRMQKRIDKMLLKLVREVGDLYQPWYVLGAFFAAVDGMKEQIVDDACCDHHKRSVEISTAIFTHLFNGNLSNANLLQDEYIQHEKARAEAGVEHA